MPQLQRLVVTPSQFSSTQIRLTAQQQHYLRRVLRLQSGDRFIAMDGQGWWLAVLTADLTQADLVESIAAPTELPVTITLAIAMPKTGMEDIVRQTTELGVSQIIPVISQRTVLKPSPHKLDRWQRIAQEAAEQSERQAIPEVMTPQTWTDLLANWNATHSPCYLCEARGNYPHLLQRLLASRAQLPADTGERSEFSPSASNDLSTPSTLTLAIGPEGGWTEAEVNAAIEVGYQPVSLGRQILRSVTAPVVAMSLIASTTFLE
jgi:16S rRNA (uracil1498-N3)-methyltransferase